MLFSIPSAETFVFNFGPFMFFPFFFSGGGGGGGVVILRAALNFETFGPTNTLFLVDKQAQRLKLQSWAKLKAFL